MIFVCKYRRKVLQNLDFTNCLKQKITLISKKYDFTVPVMETDKDHIHLLIQATPQDNASQICKVLKQQTTFYLWKQHSEYLKIYYWNERTLCTDGYFVSSTGNVSTETLRRYIEEQG